MNKVCPQHEILQKNSMFFFNKLISITISAGTNLYQRTISFSEKTLLMSYFTGFIVATADIHHDIFLEQQSSTLYEETFLSTCKVHVLLLNLHVPLLF